MRIHRDSHCFCQSRLHLESHDTACPVPDPCCSVTVRPILCWDGEACVINSADLRHIDKSLLVL
jgi:hypothetical protein